MITVFLRVVDSQEKWTALQCAVRESHQVRGPQRFEATPETFAVIPGSPFAYWAPPVIFDCFRRLPALEGGTTHVATGAQTRDNMRFIRAGWEASPGRISAPGETSELSSGWVPLAKGGVHSPYYADVHLTVQWAYDGRELKAATSAWRAGKGWGDYWRAAINSSEYYGRPGVTWPLRTSSGLSLRAMPTGCIFGHKGPAIFVASDDGNDLLSLLAFTNSQAFAACTEMQLAAADAAARSYEVGVLQRTPVPQLTKSAQAELSPLARRAWSLKRHLDTSTEISHAFTLPALLQVEGTALVGRSTAWAEHVSAVEAELGDIQEEIDARCFNLYGIDDVDRRVITEGFGSGAGASGDTAETGAEADAEEEENEAEILADTVSLTSELVSWAVGAAWGRFDVRLATGDRPLPPEPEPFDPLPVCSPGMLTGDDGLPLDRVPAGYPLAFPENGMLVDDPGHARDLTGAVRAVFETVFGARADAIWQEAAAVLDPGEHDLRGWLASGFFEHHLKRHSKSRRKAPIIWQLGIPSGRYGVWLYAHRLTRDSFFQLQNDVVAPKLAHEERQLTNLRNATTSSSAKERKEIDLQEAFVEELRALLDEVKRITPLWNPMLDDGVVLTMAPLWRLVPHHKGWQRELKGKWDELCAGKYDWTHLAMHLWPERVVPKCATDRSLAIAHGLEEVFWLEGEDGKWKPRATPGRSFPDLVTERTSPAVKAALTSLLNAPAAARTRQGRSPGRNNASQPT